MGCWGGSRVASWVESASNRDTRVIQVDHL
jgi:hypothetical protein